MYGYSMPLVLGCTKARITMKFHLILVLLSVIVIGKQMLVNL